MSENRWSIPMDRLVEKSKARLDVVVRRTILEVFVNVVRRSPVLTGAFRANWAVSFGTPTLTVTSATDKTLGTARREVQKVMTLPTNGIMYLANGLPYAGRLENGSSKQSPYGMVKVAVAQFDSAVRKALAS